VTSPPQITARTPRALVRITERWNTRRSDEKRRPLIMQMLNLAYDPSSRHAEAAARTLPHIASPAEVSCQEA